MFRISKCIALLFLLFFLVLAAQPVFAGPASPELLTLTNPDGTSFKARIRGDEFQNWTEAENGYSVVKNPASKYWEYAEKASDGAFRNSGKVFTPNAIPLPDIPKWLKPDRNTRSEEIHNRMIKDIFLERRAPASSKSSMGAAAVESAAGDWVPTPVSGTRKMLVILVNFADRSLVTTPGGWNSTIFDTSSGVKSMANYYAQNSYGTLTVSPAAHTQTGNPAGLISVTVADKHPNCGSNSDYTTETTIMNHALAQAAKNVDFAGFDSDGNGTLEQSELSIYFIFAGYEASGSSKTPNIWAHAWGGDPGLTAGGKKVARWALNGELNDSDKQHPMGVIAHEMGHALCGLPDLYDTTYTNAGLGIFSLMAGGSWGADTNESGGATPVGLDAWSRQYLGWSTPVTPSANGTHDIPLPLSSPSSSYKFVNSAVTGTEYFLAENRYPSGWDLGMKSQLGTSWQGGLLMLHVDITSGTEGSNDINKYAANTHQGVMAEEANSTDCSLVNGTCWGSANTLFYSGNNNIFTDTSSPNSKFYGGSASGFGVLSISEPEQTMSAQFSIPATSLTITANSPLADAVNVRSDTSVSVTFGKEINQSTLSSSTFYLKQGSNLVAGAISYNSATKTATFTPSSPLANGATYTATVTTGIQDQNGNSLGAGKNWTFTTIAGTTTALGNSDFESGTTGWSTALVSGTSGAWSIVSSGTDPAVSPHGGSAMVKFNSYDASSGNRARLYRSTGLSLSNLFNTVTLSFWMYHDTGWPTYKDQIQVQVSTDGSTWTNVGSSFKRSNGTTGWVQTSIDLSPYRSSSNLQIGFLAISGWGNNMYLDDVSVKTK
jgi:M6 family metalloprotease-like protein